MKLTFVRAVNKWEKDRVERIAQEKEFKNFTGLVHIAELHMPFTIPEFVVSMSEQARQYKGKKICVLAGDTVNFDTLSHYYQLSPHTLKPLDEIDKAIDVLRYLESVYDRVIYMSTNHEERLLKLLRRHLDKAQADAVNDLVECLDERFARRGLNVLYHDGWFFRIGDALISHAERNSKIAGRPVTWVIDWFLGKTKPFSVLFQAHTHKQCKVPRRKVWGIETGAMCESFDYARTARLPYGSDPISTGYGYAELKNGKSDVNKCNFHSFKWEDHI